MMLSKNLKCLRYLSGLPYFIMEKLMFSSDTGSAAEEDIENWRRDGGVRGRGGQQDGYG